MKSLLSKLFAKLARAILRRLRKADLVAALDTGMTTFLERDGWTYEGPGKWSKERQDGPFKVRATHPTFEAFRRANGLA